MTITFVSILIALIFTFTQQTAIQCEFQSSSWQKNKSIILSERQKLVSTIYANIDVVVDSKDPFISGIINDRGTWQPKNMRTMARLIKEGDTVLNIGSHIGLEAVVMGKIVGSKGRLFVFEPYSVSFSILLKNIYLNELGDIATVYNVGAGNKCERAALYVNPTNTGGSPIHMNSSYIKAPSITEYVEVDLVDEVLPEDAIVDFALIDVETMEVEVLQGMKQTILRSPNIMIMCEWSGYTVNVKDIDSQKGPILKWLSEHNFKFYQMLPESRNACDYIKFGQMSISNILYLNKIKRQIDLFIIPNSIDPNKLR